MLQTILDATIQHGIDPEFAVAFWNSLPQSDQSLASDFCLDEAYWINTWIVPELHHFLLAGMFSSQERFLQYLKRQRFEIFLLNDDCMQAIYGANYLKLYRHFRSIFIKKLTTSEKNCRDAFDWDPWWTKDIEAGDLVLNAVWNSDSLRRRRLADPLSFFHNHNKERLNYKNTFLLPKVLNLKRQIGNIDRTAQMLFLLGLFGSNENTIRSELVIQSQPRLRNIEKSVIERKYTTTALYRILTDRFVRAIDPLVERTLDNIMKDESKKKRLLDYIRYVARTKQRTQRTSTDSQNKMDFAKAPPCLPVDDA